MRLLFLTLSLLMAAPSWSSQETVHVYVCDAGTVRAHAAQTQDIPNIQALIRSGNAYWLDGRIDQSTSQAMFEGLGIWGYAPVHGLFSMVHTQTSPKFLAAVALTETGRNNRPWPWTINWRGKSIYLASKEAAIDKARRILSTGDDLFDVGVMQTNWRFNGHRFSSIEQAFEPLVNIAVADQIIQEHLRATGSLIEAVGRYHSKTASLKSSYQTRVLSHLDFIGRSSKLGASLPTTC
jgi:hypothetical protein